MVSFNTMVTPWRNRLTKINGSTTAVELKKWINELNATGSTNTLEALRFALSDTEADAIYLLTDGRPDQVMLLLSYYFLCCRHHTDN
jgi:von Willebrand factor A domain-containing protein 3